jgi:hypothetical protein
MSSLEGGERSRLIYTLLVSALLAAAGCAYQPPEGPKLPVGIQVENPGHLAVAVVDTTRRPLTAGELRPLERAGFRWDFQVRLTDTAGVGINLVELQVTVQSLSGVTAQQTIPLRSRVEPQGTTPIAVVGTLTTSKPEEPANLTGVEELVFLGQDDRGAPVRLIVRVPLV